MSYMKVSGLVAALVTALALSAGAYGDTGKSPNGAPGPAGNPNQPAAQPQANGPQGPAGNSAQGKSDTAQAQPHGNSGASHGRSDASHGKSDASHGKSDASHGKSDASHGKSDAAHGNSESHPSNKSHANPNPGTPRKGGREDRPAGKITICHATRSAKNPYVEITISMNGLHGHGPADDSRHHAGSWKDIIPAPAGGCPGTVQPETSGPAKTEQRPAEQARVVAATPEVATTAPATAAETQQPQQAVLGVQAAGTTAPADAGKVLGASASGTAVPNAALAARKADAEHGSLPFTGYELAVVLLAAAAALLGGFALRRALAGNRS